MQFMHMILLSPDSLRPTKPEAKARGTVKHRLAAFFMALSLGLSHCAAAAPLRAEAIKTPTNMPYACSSETAEGMLLLLMEHAKNRNEGIIVANWFLHPDGFAFQIPYGLAPADTRQGRSLLSANRSVISLMDPSQENDLYQTNFLLSITNEDDRLKTMQKEDAERLFSSQFDRFSLISFTKVITCGGDGIRLSFLTGRSPRLQVQQCMFVKNGKTYIATMVSENKLHSLPDAWRQFDTIYSSLFFIDDTP